MSEALRLAALMCSRVCHDLISPVSALSNGLEVLGDDEIPEMHDEAMKLIAASSERASIRLQFARLAFGASNFAADELPFTEAQKVLDALLQSDKLKLKWHGAERVVDKSLIKILMNLAVIAADMIPRGGELSIACAPDLPRAEFTLTARGERARLGDDVRGALYGQVAVAELDARSIQPFVTGLLVRDGSLVLDHHAGENCVELRVFRR